MILGIDFSLNERCAAGSGAFLEQQAIRLKIGTEEFSDLAVRAVRGATVAGRCSVFAKTDMIHLQQKGTPTEEIAYGVCLALVRNFVATILKGRDCVTRLFEPDYKSILAFSRPYINPENNSILLLNIAKMVDYAKRGADGIINVICMNCMLGTVSEAMSAQVKRDSDNIPLPTLIFSGSDISSENAKLEAFVYQVKRYAEKKKQEKLISGLSSRCSLTSS